MAIDASRAQPALERFPQDLFLRTFSPSSVGLLDFASFYIIFELISFN